MASANTDRAIQQQAVAEKEAEVVYLDVKQLADFDKFKGKLKGKYVLISDPVEITAHFDPQAERLADSALLKLANADQQPGRQRRRSPYPRRITENIDSALAAARKMNPDIDSAAFVRRTQQMLVNPRKLEFAKTFGLDIELGAPSSPTSGPHTDVYVAGSFALAVWNDTALYELHTIDLTNL